jgi:molybdopterin converting factor small subunit
LFYTKTGNTADTVFLEGEFLKPDYIVLMNGRNIHALDGVFTTITETCEISFFPPIGGGDPVH